MLHTLVYKGLVQNTEACKVAHLLYTIDESVVKLTSTL